MPQLLMLLITIAAFPAPVEAAQAPGSEVPFSDDGHGGIVVPAVIEGQGPFRFVLDTGATLSTVSADIATRFALTPVARTVLTTVGGAEMRPVLQLGAVAVGAVERRGLLASLATRDELASVGSGVDGVLGQDFLSTYNFTVDYRRRRLVWDDLQLPGTSRAPKDAVRLPLIPRDGRYVIRLPQLGYDEPIEMVPDSGASSFVLFSREGRPAPWEWLPATATISGLTGSQEARYARLRELRIGSLTLRNIPVVVVGRDDGEHEGADGLLPLHTFSRVTFRISEG